MISDELSWELLNRPAVECLWGHVCCLTVLFFWLSNLWNEWVPLVTTFRSAILCHQPARCEWTRASFRDDPRGRNLFASAASHKAKVDKEHNIIHHTLSSGDNLLNSEENGEQLRNIKKWTQSRWAPSEPCSGWIVLAKRVQKEWSEAKLWLKYAYSILQYLIYSKYAENGWTMLTWHNLTYDENMINIYAPNDAQMDHLPTAHSSHLIRWCLRSDARQVFFRKLALLIVETDWIQPKYANITYK